MTDLITAGRAFAETLFVDACTIRHKTGEQTDHLIGAVTPAWQTVYTGKCRLQHATALGQRVDVGESSAVLLRLEVQLPIAGTEAVDVGDEVIVTAAVHDAALVGRVFRVRDLAYKTHATSRRLGVEEVT